MTTKPQATEKERDIYKTEKRPDVKSGELIKVKIHAGKETVRKAYCERHMKTSSTFHGVLPAGWMFWCAGGLPVGLNRDIKVEDEGHRFIAVPA